MVRNGVLLDFVQKDFIGINYQCLDDHILDALADPALGDALDAIDERRLRICGLVES